MYKPGQITTLVLPKKVAKVGLTQSLNFEKLVLLDLDPLLDEVILILACDWHQTRFFKSLVTTATTTSHFFVFLKSAGGQNLGSCPEIRSFFCTYVAQTNWTIILGVERPCLLFFFFAKVNGATKFFGGFRTYWRSHWPLEMVTCINPLQPLQTESKWCEPSLSF